MRIRKAVKEDAKGIAKVHVDSWRTTYKNIIPDSYLDKLSYEQRMDLWERNMSDESNYIIVAENEDGQIIGFGTAGKRPENKEENTSDLTSIYLLEDYQGKGIGKALFAELFRHYSAKGYKNVFVEVLSENKTRYFYERYGAKLEREIQINIGGKTLNEMIYVWNDVEEVYRRSKINESKG